MAAAILPLANPVQEIVIPLVGNRAGKSKAPEEAADEKAKTIIEKINNAKTPEELSDMVQPGENRKSVLNAFNKRAAELNQANSDPTMSTHVNAAEAVAHIEKLQTVEAVKEFVGKDDRKEVKKAVTAAIKTLGG